MVRLALTEACIRLLEAGITEANINFIAESLPLDEARRYIRLGIQPTFESVKYTYTTVPQKIRDSKVVKLARRAA